MIFKIFFVVSLAALCAGMAISVDLWKNKKEKSLKALSIALPLRRFPPLRHCLFLYIMIFSAAIK